MPFWTKEEEKVWDFKGEADNLPVERASGP